MIPDVSTERDMDLKSQVSCFSMVEKHTVSFFHLCPWIGIGNKGSLGSRIALLEQIYADE